MLGRAREGCREAGCAYWSMCKPITPCYRHAFGDQYKATDIPIRGPGKLELVFHPEGGGEAQRYEVHNFDGAGDLPWQAGLHALAQSAVHAAGLSWARNHDTQGLRSIAGGTGTLSQAADAIACCMMLFQALKR